MKKKNNKKSKDKDNLPVVKQEVFKPMILLKDLGTDKDPCFGKLYNLSTDECKQCGDSELCCIKMAESQGISRKELEEHSKFKDLEVLVDKKAVFKSIRNHKRKGLKRAEIYDRLRAKYDLSLEEVKSLYKEYKLKKQKDNE